MIQIIIEEEVVNFYVDNRDAPIYSISKAELPRTRTENGRKTSIWVANLMGKPWIEEGDLYNLAVLIQKEFPENDIDWAYVFFPAEKRQYLKHVRGIKTLTSENDKTEKASKNAIDRIKMGMEEQNDEVNEKISEIVERNLVRYRLK